MSYRKFKNLAMVFLLGFVALGYLFLNSERAMAQGFSTGDQFVATELSGSITLTCTGNGGYDSRYHRCDASILDPNEFDYFVFNEKVNADEVELTSVFRNKEVKQTQAFDGNAMKSKKRFNLWIWTLFQTPLLQDGENTITYRLLKNKVAVKTGTFKVTVSDGGSRSCRHGYYNGFGPNDCVSSTMYCNRYFEDENYCK